MRVVFKYMKCSLTFKKKLKSQEAELGSKSRSLEDAYFSKG